MEYLQCDGQISVKLDKPKPDGRGGLIYNIPVNCGKCLNCKKNRVNQWSLRLMKELEVSDSAKFVTLTYDTNYVPITERGMMTLKKVSEKLEKIEGESKAEYRSRCQKRNEKDVSLQGFFKRLRYFEKQRKGLSKEAFEIISRGGKIEGKKIKFYAVGEYGTKRHRPHYHIILFNVMDSESIKKAWPYGGIHIDVVNANTIDYTLKYIMKSDGQKPRKGFDGEKEFSLSSKKLGMNFLTPDVIRFHKKNLDINYTHSSRGFKVGMPKIYRDRILDKKEKDKQIGIIKRAVEEENAKISDKDRILAAKVRDVKLKRSFRRPID